MEWNIIYLRETAIAGNNAGVPPRSWIIAAKRARPTLKCLTILIAGALAMAGGAGCSAPAKDFVDKVTIQANDQCRQGNQAACHTIVQQLTETKVGIEDTSNLGVITSACDAGTIDACEQAAVLHVELSGWCAAGNARACAAVNIGPWPKKMDEPALIDAAKLACLSGHFKETSNTCQALSYM